MVTLSTDEMREYMREYRGRRRAEAIAALGGVCVRCGTDQNLEFDHIDPSTKSFTISGFFQSKARMAEELAKCQLLCADHHREKTISEQRSQTGLCIHGHPLSETPSGRRICKTYRYGWNKAHRERRRAASLPVA